jgi:UDP-N-acetylmuramyl tripeptide synthase
MPALMPTSLTIAITKTAGAVTRLLGRGGGTALPGLMAEHLDPELARKLVSGLKNGVILVTGTNGKTTTTKLLAAALKANGERVLTNQAGSNLKRGVVSSIIKAANWQGHLDATIGLFEVDEASVRLLVPLLQPRQIVVLNLFRDQLDRYGELDTTAALIGEGIAATQAQIVLNADDPLVASLSSFAARPELVSYFGISGLPSDLATSDRSAADSDRCPICSRRLDFSRVFYAHLGHYRCPEGHFNRPQPIVAMTRLETTEAEGSRFEVSAAGKRHTAQIKLPGVYNLYNALAGLAAATTYGLGVESVLESFATTEAAFGRVEQISWRGRQLYLLLIKNPTGCTQVIETFLVRADAPKVVLAINDNYADGRDVSWLWDVPFERLTASGAELITSGLRATDMSLRLHYADLDSHLEPELVNALDRLASLLPEGGTGYLLPTYTAMLALRKLLGREATLASEVTA